MWAGATVLVTAPHDVVVWHLPVVAATASRRHIVVVSVKYRHMLMGKLIIIILLII